MTEWPWTQDLPVAVADPIDPLDEYDKRPSIKALIQKHGKEIAQMCQGLKDDPLYDPNKHDDLWILRFLMSHKYKVKPALEAAKYTLQCRQKHDLDKTDLRKLQPYGKDSFIEAVRIGAKHIQPGALVYSTPDSQRGVIIMFHSAGIDTNKIVEERPDHPHSLNYHMYLSEWTFQWNDYVSRKTGRLTKAARILDVSGLGFGDWNREHSQRTKRAAKVLEPCYPQNLAGIFICNSPDWVEGAWRTFRFLLPKRIVEKADFINPKENQIDKAKLLKFIGEDTLPERFGGSYQAWPVEYPIPEC